MMRLVLRQADGTHKEFKFEHGPIHVGRASDSSIFLPSRGVSRRHAVIDIDSGGNWTVEDKGSANKTFLNGEAVGKARIKSGDHLRIVDFDIEVGLEDETDAGQPISPEETLVEATLAVPLHETVVRKPDAAHAPAMRLAARRLSDFAQASEAICQAGSIEQLLLTLRDITLRQFSAYHIWCALREQPSGPMMYHVGKRRDGRKVELSDIPLQEKINQAIERHQSLVLPRVSAQVEEKERIRSAMIAAILRPAGCCGVIYVDNAMVHEHYSLSDLDYLMLIAMHTAAVLGRLI
jgi:predicted component of type VI protein secretion system